MAKASKAAKAAKTGGKDNLSWETSLQMEEIDEESWKACIILATPATVEDDFALQLLVNGIRSGQRKLVKVITRDELIQQIKEGGKIAGKKIQGRESAWLGAYEIAKMYLDNGEDIPLAIWARIIKAKILTLKEEDLHRREAEKKFLESRTKKPGETVAGGRRSPGKKTKKPTEKEADADAPKVDMKLVKRGDEPFVAEYAEDEPEDGPQQYVCIAGFRDAYLPSVLLTAGVHPWAVLRVSAEDYGIYNGLAPLNGPQSVPPPDMIEEFERQKQNNAIQLHEFWRDVGLVLSQPGDSSELHNVPVLEFTYKLSHFVPFADTLASLTATAEEKIAASATFCEDFSTIMYDLVDWRRQYQTWLSHCRVIGVSQMAPPINLDDYGQIAVAPVASVSNELSPVTTEAAPPLTASVVDMRYYNTVMDSIPDELCTVPLVLHCMLEQVTSTVEGRSPPDTNPTRQDGLPQNVVEIFNALISKSSLSKAEIQNLRSELQLSSDNKTADMTSKMKTPELYAFGDDRALRQRCTMAGDEPNSKLQASNRISKPTRPLIDIAEAERQILKFSPMALAIANTMEYSDCSAIRKTALQNMLASLAQSTGLTPLELGYVLKLLMFESLTLPSIDDDGFIAMQRAESVLPWDDPYPFFKGMITEDELEQIKEDWKEKLTKQFEIEREEEQRRSKLEQQPSVEPKSPPPESKASSRKVKRSGSKDKSTSPQGRKSPSSAGSKRGSPKRRAPTPQTAETPKPESEISKRGIMLRSASGLRRSNFVHFERDQSGRPIRSRQRFDDLEIRMVDRPIDESIADIRRALRRKLTEYCFIEFFGADALMQTMMECFYERPLLSIYRSRQDNSLMVAFSNPRNHKMFYCEDWASRVYTNVGFRKYLLYVAPNIADWLVHQESSYMGRLLAQDLDDEAANAASSAATRSAKGKDKRNRSTSPKKGKKGEKDKSEEEKGYQSYITNEFTYHNSLKQQKIDEDERKKADEVKQGGRKARSKSPSKRTASPRATSQGSQSRVPSGEKVSARRADSAHSIDVERDRYPFTAYDLANQMLAASGLTATLLPADGGIIRAERFRFETGKESVRVSCIIDSNVFAVHIISPSGNVVQTDDLETDSSAPPVSHFGSVTANLANGIVLSVSSFGPDGFNKEGAPYAPKPCKPGSLGPPGDGEVPIVPQTSTPGTAKKRGKSPTTRSKSPKGKAIEKEPPKEATPLEVPATVESEDTQRSTTSEPQTKPVNLTKSPMNISFPNGLSVKFFHTQDEFGRALMTVRQSFESRRHPMSQNNAETSRLVTHEGCAIRFLQNGETEILYPDGSIHRSLPVQVQLSTEEVAVVEAAAVPEKEMLDSRGRKAAGQRGARPAKPAALASVQAKEPVTTTEPTKVTYHVITHVTADGWISKFNTYESVYVEPKRKLAEINRTDAATGQKWISREDGIEIVHVPSGAAGNPPGVATRCVLFADGTCTTSRIETIVSEVTGDEDDVLTWVRVEAPAFATVTVDRLRWETQLDYGNDLVKGVSQLSINCLPDQSFQFFPSHGGRILVDSQSRMMYWPSGSSAPQDASGNAGEHVYLLSHNSPTVVQVVDPVGNSFSVSHDGRAAVVSRQQLEQQQQKPSSGQSNQLSRVDSGSKKIEENAGDEHHAPRMFVVSPDSEGIAGGWELKRYRGDVGDSIMNGERDDRCHLTRRAIEDEPRVASITLLQPFAQLPVDKWIGTKCTVQELAPPGLHPVGWYVPRSNKMNTGPTTLLNQTVISPGSLPRIEVRRMFQLTPFTDPIRDVLFESLRGYVESIVENNMIRRYQSPTDPRSEQEIRNAEIILSRFSMIGSPRSQEESNAALTAEMEALGSPSMSPKLDRQLKSIKYEKRRVERLQAEEDRKAYRNGAKMAYFKSEMSHDFLKSQAPNLEDYFTTNELEKYAKYDSSFEQNGRVLVEGSNSEPELEHSTKFVIPEEIEEQRSATPIQRQKLGAKVMVLNTQPANTQQSRDHFRSGPHDITKTPLLLPNVLLVQPSSGIDFGEVSDSTNTSRQLVLKNAGQRPIRFVIKEPLPQYGVFLAYEHGPIAAGMKRPVTVTIKRNARSGIVDSGAVEIKIRYEGGELLIPVRFREVKEAPGRSQIRANRNALMSYGSDGDEVMTEIFEAKSPPRPAGVETNPESTTEVFEAPANSDDEGLAFQPKPPSYPRKTSPQSAIA